MSYFTVIQIGTFGDPSYNTAEFIRIVTPPTTTDIAQAMWFISPEPIKSLRTNLAAVFASGDVGFLSIQIVDTTLGNPLPGIDSPAFIGSANVNGTVATHTLTTSLPAETPFAIRFLQDGIGTASYRFYIIAET